MGLLDKWNKNKFSIYESEEKTVLKLIESIGKWLEELIKVTENKTDLYGDHKGSWQGLNRPTLSEEGMRATLEQLNDETIPNIKKQIADNANKVEQIIDETIPNIEKQMVDNTNKIGILNNRADWVSVKEFGAKGDGVTDDTEAIQNALNSAGMRTIFFPTGTYLIRSVSISHSSTNIVGDSKATTFIKAKSEVQTLFAIKDSAYITIKNITFDGNNLAQTCLDTSWTQYSAPSLCSRYEEVRIRGYKGIGWLATSNNDCVFDHCLIEKSGTNTGLQILAYGGAIIFDGSIFFAPIEIGCQNAMFNSCVLHGVIVKGNDNNHIAMNGSYWYADQNTGTNLFLKDNSMSYSPAFNGVRIENGSSNGTIIGGTGTLYGGAVFSSPHIFTTDGAKNVQLLASTVKNGGPIGRVRVLGGNIQGIITNDTPQHKVILENVNVEGYITKSRLQIAATGDGISYKEISSKGFRHVNDYGQVGIFLADSTPTISKEQSYTITGAPSSGIIILRGSMGDSPIAVFAYGKSQWGNPGVVTKITEQTGLPSGSISLYIPPATNELELRVSHTFPSPIVLHYSIIGTY